MDWDLSVADLGSKLRDCVTPRRGTSRHAARITRISRFRCGLRELSSRLSASRVRTIRKQTEIFLGGRMPAFVCIHCSATVQAAYELVGTPLTCPRCGQGTQVLTEAAMPG